MSKKIEKYLYYTFGIITLLSLISLLLIAVFLLIQGVKPFLSEDGPTIAEFLTGLQWHPSQNIYGIGYMIIGTLLSTFGAIVIAVPVGIFTALAISEFLPKKLASTLSTMVEILASIPSVLFGLFGIGVILPFVKNISGEPQGNSLIAVILVLSIMIIPTIIALSVASLKSVDKNYKEASYGLGSNKIQTSFKIVLPAARSGIITSVILGVSRAIGETMAVILVAGNPESGIPTSIFDSIRPMTSNIALEIGYASGIQKELLFTTGLILFIIVIFLNIIIAKKVKKGII